MLNYYRASGKISISSFIYFFISILLILPVLSWLYVHAIWINPLHYANFLITFAFGACVGFTLYYFIIGLGKVRNQNLALGLGIVAGFFAWYVHWAFWINLKFSSPEHMVPFFFVSLNPVDLFSRVSEINQARDIVILGIHIKGMIITLIWGLEGVIITGIAIRYAVIKSHEPFGESENSWGTKTILSPFEYIQIGWWLRSTLEDDDSTFLKTIKKATTDQQSHSIFTLYRCGDHEHYLSINNRLIKTTDHGKSVVEEDELIRQIFIDKSSVDYLLSFENNPVAASSNSESESSWKMKPI